MTAVIERAYHTELTVSNLHNCITAWSWYWL